MQDKNDLLGTTLPVRHASAAKRKVLWRTLGFGFVASVAALMVIAFAIFSNPSRPLTSSVGHSTQTGAGNNGPLVCSISNNNSKQQSKSWTPTLDWSSQGQIATTFLNLKVFSGTNCNASLTKSTPDFSGTWSPDGQKLATLTSNNADITYDNGTSAQLSMGGTLSILDSKGVTLAQFSSADLGAGWASNFIWSADGSRLIFLSSDSQSTTTSVKSVEAVKGGKVATLFTINIANAPLNQTPELISLSPDGKQVAVALLDASQTQNGASAQNASALEIWDIANQKQESRIALTQNGLPDAAQIAWSPDGSQIALVAGSQNNTVQVYSTAKGALQTSFVDQAASAQGIGTLAWSPDGDFLAEGASAVKVWNVSQHSLSATFGQVNSGQIVSALAWSPNSKELVSATTNVLSTNGDNSKNTVNVWRLS